MRRTLGWPALCAAIAATTMASAIALAADPPPTGPVYPLPDSEPATFVGDHGRAGGITYTYTDLQPERYDPVTWGAWTGALPQLAMDGAVDEPGETMSFSATDSDLGAGKAVYTGSAGLPDLGSTYDTRAIVRSLTPGDAPLPMTAAASLELPEDIGGAAVITGDFKSNVVLEVRDGSTWTPAADFYDAAPTNPGNPPSQLVTSSSFGFYTVPANVLPAASFTWEPEPQTAGRMVQFASTSTDEDGEIVETTWDLDNDGDFDDATGTTASHVYNADGVHTVRVRVVDDRDDPSTGSNDITIVPNQTPSVDFEWTPQTPRVFETTQFTASASDIDGEVIEIVWDLDDDGEFDDGTGTTASFSFTTDGDHDVSVRATDDLGGVRATTHAVTVLPNAAPEVSFSWVPASPRALKNVTFTASASDIDGQVVEIVWDLDNDGEFDDGSGTSVTTKFSEGGDHTVRVRAVDDGGAASVAENIVSVDTCEPGNVSKALRELGAAVHPSVERIVRSVNCAVLRPLGL